MAKNQFSSEIFVSIYTPSKLQILIDFIKKSIKIREENNFFHIVLICFRFINYFQKIERELCVQKLKDSFLNNEIQNYPFSLFIKTIF